MKSKPAKPFVKWAGGKYRIADQLNSFKPKVFNRYFEPMVGSGGLFFSNPAKKAYLSDINSKLINTYKVIKNQATLEELIHELHLIKSITHSKDSYKQIRDEFNKDDVNYINSAVYFIYLNKMCFNGLYRENSKGHFNVPMGDKRTFSVDEDNLRSVSKVLQDIDIEYHNYEDIKPKKGDFVYFDPPYIPLDKISFTKYSKNDFNRDEHIKLSEFCSELTESGVYFMLSNSDTVESRDIYSSKERYIKSFLVQRNIASKAKNRKKVKELIITNYKI
jgi:DNA adenine methylase